MKGSRHTPKSLWIEHTEGNVARNHEIARLYAAHAALNRFQDPDQLAALSARDVIAGYQAFSRRFLRSEVNEGFQRRFREGLATAEADLENIPGRHGLAQLAAMGVPEAFFPGAVARTGDPGPTELFSSADVYERGALTLHALRLRVGDDAFFAILRTWTSRFHNGNATTEGFFILAEEIGGEELDEFFDAWLFGYALPPLHPDSAADSGAATPVAG